MSDNTPKIELHSVTVVFGDKTPLRDFNLSIQPSERVRISGRSGSGKSTVLRTILGFVQPREGSVVIEGETLDAHSVWNLRTRLAYVAQEPELGRGTVRDILERPFQYHANASLRHNLERVDGLAERFMLGGDILDQKMEDLSGGEKQRVAIISALLLERKILLLDEASSALDPESKASVADYLRDDHTLTIVSVSHEKTGFDIGERTISLTGGTEAKA